MRSVSIAASVAALLVSSTAHAEDGQSPPLSIYGFARLDVLADSARMSDIAQPQWVLTTPPDGPATSEATMTPRLSRVGLSIDKWDLTNDSVFTGEGKLEVDFAGGSGSNAIRLRHAYAAIALSRYGELLAGQTWDLISPLFPTAQNDTQLLFAGNTGDRRPQLRLSITPTKKLTFAIAGAASGTVDAIDHSASMPAASPTLMLQWLAEYHPTKRNGDQIRVGVWGHIARDDLANGMRHAASSVGGHLYVPVQGRVIVFGEIYTGTNLADIGGGIGQGVNPTTGNVIHSTGGWAELAVIPTQRHMLSVGASIDRVRDGDVEIGDRERNATIYGVVLYKPRPTLQFGAEYLRWRTQYKAMNEGVANRMDMHLSVFF